MSVVAGVDVGSLTSKAAILMGGDIVYSLVPTTVSSEKSGLAAFEQALEKAGVRQQDIDFTVATGYGRISAPYADAKVTEITCHARGAYFLNPNVRTVLDMGGQDCKVIRVGEEGSVGDFVMNDKCAAGTGRFLEALARIFEVRLDQLGDLCLKAEERVPISSTCTVFAESELQLRLTLSD
jgi:predicted CoA-substrate-specific enzyme activase